MDQAQQLALEGLAGRALGVEEVAQLAPLVVARNDAAVAQALSQGRTRRSRLAVGNGLILETVGFEYGNALLDFLSGNAAYRHVWPLVQRGELDISSPLVEASLQAMVPDVVPQAAAEALLALGRAPNPVSVDEVSGALNALEGAQA